MAKTNTTDTASVKTDGDTPPDKETLVKVCITKHGTHVGNLICARGKVVLVTQSQADALIKADLGRYIGV